MQVEYVVHFTVKQWAFSKRVEGKVLTLGEYCRGQSVHVNHVKLADTLNNEK
jgi:hypothetical protein